MVFIRKRSKKLVFQNFSKTSLLKNGTSRAELFDQKLEPKTEVAEPRLGSNTSKLYVLFAMISATKRI